MALSTSLHDGDSTREQAYATERPTKKPRIGSKEVMRNDEPATYVRRHPLGIRPTGNALTSSIDLRGSCGYFAVLPDELLTVVLEALHAPALLNLGATCKALHAHTRNEELWRTLFIECPPKSFSWRGTWRSTFLGQPSIREPKIDCSGFFSDVLHRPFLCANISLAPFVSSIPNENRIWRLDDLTRDEFAADWCDLPFILTSPIKQWPVFKTWSTERLLKEYANVAFRAESVDWPLGTYVEYMRNSQDESPLYLFDRSFVEKMNLKVSSMQDDLAAYWPPNCFGEDLFELLQSQRPDHRWLIIGPERSGSTFHKDPNATSAWNAVLKGSKYWIMFPSSGNLPPPPGVYVSEDQSEVTSPLSIAEWLLGFHAEARRTPGCREGICYEGEVLHVPSGWYHLVVNLEPSIAVTQNFVPRRRLGAVLQFLRDQKHSISGFSDDIEDPYSLFVERLKEHDKTLLEEGLQHLDRLTKGNKTKWEQLTKGNDDPETDCGGFSFGFGIDEDE